MRKMRWRRLLYPELSTPAVVVDLDAVDRNIGRLAQRLAGAGVAHRPHVKTHKSVALARRQLAAGAVGITVAKVSEAEVFAAAGFRDIFIAFTLVGEDKLQRLAALHRRMDVSTTVDGDEAAAGLARVGELTGKPVPVLIEVDGGLHRGGRQPGEDLMAFARRIAALPGLRVDGIMSYFGHVYGVAGLAEREAFAIGECEFLARAAAGLRAVGVPVVRVSGGSTPAVHTAAPMAGLTEVRSGNYIFYDATALALGFAQPEDCALRVVATVVSTPLPGRASIDAGTKTLTSDGGHGVEGFGHVVGHPDVRVAKLNEEHGFLTFDPGRTTFRVGDRIEIIPNHSCVLPNLCDTVAGVRGGREVERIRIDARGCNT